MDAYVLAIDGLVHVLLARRFAVDVAEDLVASLHTRARRRQVLLGWRVVARGRGRGRAREETRGGTAQGGKQRRVDEVGVAGVARGERVGEGQGRDGERGQREQGRAERGDEVGEGVDGGGGRGELQQRGEGEAGDGVGDALGGGGYVSSASLG